MLVLWKTIRLFANTLIPDGKYSFLIRDKLTQPLQILLSQKQKSFSQFFSSFLKSTLNFEPCRKKDETHSRCISKITNFLKGD